MSVSDQTLALMRRMPSERISVLVVGDQGVGKTSLVRCLCSEIDGKADGVGLAPVRPTETSPTRIRAQPALTTHPPASALLQCWARRATALDSLVGW